MPGSDPDVGIAMMGSEPDLDSRIGARTRLRHQSPSPAGSGSESGRFALLARRFIAGRFVGDAEEWSKDHCARHWRTFPAAGFPLTSYFDLPAS
jgi:hypothetical protein